MGTISCFIVLTTIPFTSAYLPIWVFQAAYTIMNLFGSLAFISSQFSHVLMAATVIISSTIILLLPLGINVFAPDNTATEWSRIFIALPCIQIVTISIFLFTCDSKPGSWTYSQEEQEKEMQTKTNITL
uniref:NADH dehydrogenase subunit 6 n=1 Tax=Ditylenchus dipsaci TaxID=166011 RepID=A0A915E848_9BILA